MGAKAYLAKPFNAQTLLEEIASLIGSVNRAS
jgi:DNA-binding response OmpR family regulator